MTRAKYGFSSTSVLCAEFGVVHEVGLEVLLPFGTAMAWDIQLRRGVWDCTPSKLQHAQKIVRCELEIKRMSHRFCGLGEKGRYLNLYPRMYAYAYEKRKEYMSIHTQLCKKNMRVSNYFPNLFFTIHVVSEI